MPTETSYRQEVKRIVVCAWEGSPATHFGHGRLCCSGCAAVYSEAGYDDVRPLSAVNGYVIAPNGVSYYAE